MQVLISPNDVRLNDFAVTSPCAGEDYCEVLGRPSRIDAGEPAPIGFRNNQVWYFDDIGVYLMEHHATRLITSIGFVFNLKAAYRKPLFPFCDQLGVCGVPVITDMRAGEFQEQCNESFHWHLGRSLVVDFDTLSIDIGTYFKTKHAPRNVGNRLISDVAVGFATPESRKVRNANLQAAAESREWSKLMEGR
jgi:hypothetical protein